MATVKAVLNKDRKKKNGTYSLVIQVIHKRIKRVIYTPYQLKEEEFNNKLQQALYTTGVLYTRIQIKEINNFINAKKQELQNIIEQMTKSEKNFTTEDIISKYRIKQSDKFIITFMEHHIAKKEEQGKLGTARTFRCTMRSLKKYIGNREIKFSDVDNLFIKGYEEFLVRGKIKQNTIVFYMRNFRTIYNLAGENGIETGDYNAFRNIKLRSVRTTKRALKREIIEQIALINLSIGSPLDKARDLFMFSFYTRGMSFVDIIYLKHTDIVDGVISYRRRKTNQFIEVAVVAPLKELIEKYKTDSEYVLPFINENNYPTLYGRYLACYSVFHRNLNILQKMLKITTPLTTYVARHSWATIAKEQGISTSVISEGLGHFSEQTTQIYLKEFDRTVIDLANEKVISF